MSISALSQTLLRKSAMRQPMLVRWLQMPKAAWLLSCRGRPQLASGRLVVFFILNTCPWPSAASLVGYAEADAGVIVPNVKTL